MRIIAAICLVLLFVMSGCASEPYSFVNGGHFGRHISCIYLDLHDWHKDFDHCILGIKESEEEYKNPFTLRSRILD